MNFRYMRNNLSVIFIIIMHAYVYNCAMVTLGGQRGTLWICFSPWVFIWGWESKEEPQACRIDAFAEQSCWPSKNNLYGRSISQMMRGIYVLYTGRFKDHLCMFLPTL